MYIIRQCLPNMLDLASRAGISSSNHALCPSAVQSQEVVTRQCDTSPGGDVYIHTEHTRQHELEPNGHPTKAQLVTLPHLHLKGD